MSALVALQCAALVGEAPPSQTFRKFNLERIRAFRAEHDRREPGTLRIVLLGNSRLKNATLANEVFNEVDGGAVKRIEVFRLVANWAVFTTFEPLIDEVRALQPDAYVIQMDLLVHTFARQWKTRISFSYLRWLTSGSGPWTWYEPQEEQLAQACDAEQVPEPRAKHATDRLIVDTQSKSAQLSREFIRKVVADGARVLLVSVPKRQDLENMLPSVTPEMLASARDLSRDLPRVTVASYAEVLLDDRQFCDVSHMSSSGAAEYSRWLTEQIIAAEARE